MRRPIIAIALCGLLAACGSTPKPVPTVTVTCLPMVTYTPAFQSSLAAALAGQPADSPIAQVLLDYEALRDQDRACLAANPGAIK